MYDPRSPNHYAAAVARRQEEARVKAAAVNARPVAALPSPVVTVAAASAAEFASLSADEIVRRRIEASASLGVQGAEAMRRDEAAAALRQRQHDGVDPESKARLAMAAMGHVAGSALGSGGRGGGLVHALQFTATHVLGGALTIAEGRGSGAPAAGGAAANAPPGAQLSRPRVPGRPSSVLCLENVATPTPDDDQALGEDVAGECCRFGHVRALRVFRSAQHLPRVFVKFDSVASALKAAEAMQDRLFDGRRVRVTFYGCATFDRGEFGEPLAAPSS